MTFITWIISYNSKYILVTRTQHIDHPTSGDKTPKVEYGFAAHTPLKKIKKRFAAVDVHIHTYGATQRVT